MDGMGEVKTGKPRMANEGESVEIERKVRLELIILCSPREREKLITISWTSSQTFQVLQKSSLAVIVSLRRS